MQPCVARRAKDAILELRETGEGIQAALENVRQLPQPRCREQITLLWTALDKVLDAWTALDSVAEAFGKDPVDHP